MYNKLNLLLILLTCAVAPLLAEIKILHGPYLQNLGENEVTIVWVSDKPSIGWLEIAPDDGSHFYATERQKIFDTKIGIKNTSRIHSVKLEGLKPATTYRYRVCAQEVISHEGHKVIYGDITTAFSYAKEANSFTTNDATKPSVSFAMVNDIHGRNDVLENMINQCNLETTDLFLFNGDMVSISDNEEQMFGGFMDKAVELFASNLPMYYCRGNHETRGAMAPNFKDYFNPKADELFYAFRQGPVCFLVLDCLYRNAPFKVVVCHMPPFGGWHGELDILKKFIPVLNQAKPDVYLTAHLHQYIRNEAGKDGVAFPLIVNSNNTLLKADADAGKLDIRIYDLDGKMIDQLVIKK